MEENQLARNTLCVNQEINSLEAGKMDVESMENIHSNSSSKSVETLLIELPSHFTQLESQTCYKIGIKNFSLRGACLRFGSELAVFPFSEVGKRPILKEEFPRDIPLEEEKDFDITEVNLRVIC